VNLGFVLNSKSFRKVEIKIFRLKFGEILPQKKMLDPSETHKPRDVPGVPSNQSP
jgi:hypothetical protein